MWTVLKMVNYRIFSIILPLILHVIIFVFTFATWLKQNQLMVSFTVLLLGLCGIFLCVMHIIDANSPPCEIIMLTKGIIIMRKITLIACLLVAIVASAQFSGSGYYRVHNVATDSYVSIRGTKYKKTTNPDAFWSCVLMLKDADQIHLSDPGSIIYIPDMGETSLCAQGVSTYSLTGLWLTVDTAAYREGGLPTYVAKTSYNGLPCIFRDYGNGFTAGYLEQAETHWWVEPVNAGSIDTSFLGLKPINETVADADGWYWSTMCCDFPFMLPVDGGIEGAYTVKEIKQGIDDLYYAAPVKVYGQGEVVPAATPVLLKCKDAEVSNNKMIPVEGIAGCRTMPIVNDLLMGNYFSNFMNHGSLTDYTYFVEYIPTQATMATPAELALGVDADGKLGFFPQPEGTYMAANTAWLSMTLTDEELAGITAVYLGEAPVAEEVKGDINGDGELTISDVTQLIHFVLSEGLNTKEEVDRSALDMNGDGQVTIGDVTILIRYVLLTEM